MKRKKGILFAADIPDKNKLFEVLDDIKPYISAIKIGNLVLYQHSLSIIREIKNIINIPILADLKLLDMPNMVGKITKSAIEAGVDGIMVAGSIGIEGILECKKYLNNNLLFVFTQFTHCDGLITEDEANQYIRLAIDMKCDGVQVPATIKNRIPKVRNMVGPDVILISCGIGTQKYFENETEGPSIGSAIRIGADYEIIGRSIYQNNSPINAAKSANKIISDLLEL